MAPRLLRARTRRRHSGALAQKDLERLERHGLEPVERLEVPLGDLRVQRRSEWRMDELLPGDRLSLVRGPWGELIAEYAASGAGVLQSRMNETSYYALFRHFSSIGFYVDWATGRKVDFRLTDQEIWDRMNRFFQTYDSLADSGYLGRGFEDRPIVVLREPYEAQRFGREMPWSGFEVWSGHHRGASLAQLGHDSAAAVLARYTGNTS